MTKNSKTLHLTQLGMLMAIVILLTITNLGHIPLGPIVATIYHIPIIIGAILLGPKAGGLLGSIWGGLVFYLTLTGQTTNIVAVTVIQHSFTDYFFIAVFPRILTGLFAGYAFKFSKKFLRHKISFCFGLAAIIGSLCNTLFYLGLLYILAKPLVAEALHINLDAVVPFILGVVCVNGSIEAILSVVIVTAVCKGIKNSNYITIQRD